MNASLIEDDELFKNIKQVNLFKRYDISKESKTQAR